MQRSDEPTRNHRADIAPNQRTETVDVVVVGARCAGAATAMLLARAGHDVLVVDRATFPSDTLSTHAIARGGVVQLQRWGLLDEIIRSGAPEIRTVEFHTPALDGRDDVTVRTVKDRHGVDALIAPRRHILDPLLQQAAVGAGARLRTGITVTGILRDDERVVGVVARDEHGPLRIDARYVVGADGLKSRIARSVGARVTERGPSTGGTLYRYYAGTWPAMEYHVGDQSFAGVFPTHHGEACVWVCASDGWTLERRRRHAGTNEAFAAMVKDTSSRLAERLDDAVGQSTARGITSIPNHLLEPVGPGWALVGDAGYHRDPITGHGISDAFRDAELLSVALDQALRVPRSERAALRAFHVERDRLLREIFDITCELSDCPLRPRFIELQKELGRAIDRHAGELARRPLHTASAA